MKPLRIMAIFILLQNDPKLKNTSRHTVVTNNRLKVMQFLSFGSFVSKEALFS